MSVTSEMYETGYTNGRRDAINCCFTNRREPTPDFDTRDEACDYEEGYSLGYDSVDD